jgi:hypothetical protein
MGEVAVEANPEVDVVGAALVEAGEDSLEADGPAGVGELDAAEEGEFVGGAGLRGCAETWAGARACKPWPARAIRFDWTSWPSKG